MSLILVCWTVLVAVRKVCTRVNFVVWDTEGRLVPCVFFIRFIIERTTPLQEHLHHFVAARITRASSALGELNLVIAHYTKDQSIVHFCPLLHACGTYCRRVLNKSATNL